MPVLQFLVGQMLIMLGIAIRKVKYSKTFSICALALFLAFEVIYITFHTIVGAIFIFLLGALVVYISITYNDLNKAKNIILMPLLLLFSLVILFQVLEAFTGRLF